MTTLTTQLPARRAELVIRSIGARGRYVVKNPDSRDYFELREEEHFLLLQLDGRQEGESARAAFAERFGQPLSEEELGEFIEMADGQGLLQEPLTPGSSPQKGEGKPAEPSHPVTPSPPHPVTTRTRQRQGILYWRKNIFDPDRIFTWLEPKIRFFWTRGFLVVSVGCIVLATTILWTGRQEVASSFAHALRWETIFFAWLTMLAVGMLHESAHGLTCKHYGGEVREIGFLLMYFMPCFYCNVSDAWLIRERSKRLWVTLAGGYFELFLWSLAVFVWRVTMPDTLINYLAFIVLTISGIDSFFNFNPLIKLDGYYLLSDLVEVPNLRQRAAAHVMAHLRWLLWGGCRPDRRPRGRFMLAYGVTCWLFSLCFLTLMLVGLYHWLAEYIGALSLATVGVLALVSARGLFGDLFREEFLTMIWHRHWRKATWLALLAGIVAASFYVPWTDHASGEFEVRAKTHAEIRAPVSGFLTKVHYDEGQPVSQDSEVARLGVPDLASRTARKEAELREAEAKLQLLRAGPSAVEIDQQRLRVDAAKTWRDVAALNLKRQRQSLEQELLKFDKLLEELQAECSFAEQVLARRKTLRGSKATNEEEYQDAHKIYLVSRARYDQAVAEKQSRATLGATLAEMALAEREKELADEQAALALLEAGSRPEAIEAAEATVERLKEELAYLHELSDRLSIRSPVSGSLTTCRLPEKIGDYFEEGELICEVEDAGTLEVMIALDEDQAARVRAGQQVRLKARSLPFEVFEIDVERIAPRATAGEVQNTVKVYCRLDDPDQKLRSGMTGHARIECGRAPIAKVLAQRCLRFLRTEFWW